MVVILFNLITKLRFAKTRAGGQAGTCTYRSLIDIVGLAQSSPNNKNEAGKREKDLYNVNQLRLQSLKRARKYASASFDEKKNGCTKGTSR